MSSLGGSRSTFCLGSKDIVFGFGFGFVCVLEVDGGDGDAFLLVLIMRLVVTWDVDDVDRTAETK